MHQSTQPPYSRSLGHGRGAARMTGGDVHGFYRALGIELPQWSSQNVSIPCFADPEAHAHGDRNPSCSVSLVTGAWRCWSCGAKGGAYDAAHDHFDRSPRDAMDLLIQYGLAERRHSGPTPRRPRPPTHRGSAPRAAAAAPSTRRPSFTASDADVAGWRSALADHAWPPAQLRPPQRCLWHQRTARELELGLDRGRITVPIRRADGELQGLLRYAPTHTRGPKMIALPGSALGLIPSPAVDASPWVLLVEGPPDMIAARSVGLPAIAVPGDYAWEPSWAAELAGRHVTVLMDCDDAGRTAARRIAADLKNVAEAVAVADLAPSRSDGYDLTDWLADHQHLPLSTTSALLGRPLQADTTPGPERSEPT